MAMTCGKLSVVTIDGRPLHVESITITNDGYGCDKYRVDGYMEKQPIISSSASLELGSSLEISSFEQLLNSKSSYAVPSGTYKNIGDNMNEGLRLQRIKNSKEGAALGNGLLYLIGNRQEIFSKNPAEYLEVRLVDWQYEAKAENPLRIEDYTDALLITGFRLPKSDSPLWGHQFKPGVFTRGNYEDGTARHIYEYVNEEYDMQIWSGLTVHDTKGTWSSWPPHEFECNALFAPTKLYPEFKEWFAYYTDPEYLWGIQVQSRFNTSSYDNLVVFKDKDIVEVPLTAHPSVGGPGTRLAYVWVYLGAAKKEY